METKKENILKVIKNFSKAKILVVGDVMLDKYTLGNIERISPEAPIPILEVKQDNIYFPGGAANTACNIKALSGSVILIGVIGQDNEGEILKKILKERSININKIIMDPKRKTTLKNRIIAKEQQIIRLDFEDKKPIDYQIENKIINFVKKNIQGIRAIIISDYAKGVITPRLSQAIIKIARNKKIYCLIDPKGDNYLKYKGCDVITPNKKELAQALNVVIKDETQFLQAGKKLLTYVMCDNVLVTRGEEGMTLFKKNGDIIHSPAISQIGKVIDITGAGDTAIAVIALSLAAGADFKQAMTIANYACAIAVTRFGAATVSVGELKKIFNYAK